MTTFVEITDLTDASKAALYEYATPSIISITYPSGSSVSTAGGATVTVSGLFFQQGTTIYVGSTIAPVVTFINDTTLTFTTPPATSGKQTLFAVNTNGGAGEYYSGIIYS